MTVYHKLGYHYDIIDIQKSAKKFQLYYGYLIVLYDVFSVILDLYQLFWYALCIRVVDRDKKYRTRIAGYFRGVSLSLICRLDVWGLLLPTLQA